MLIFLIGMPGSGKSTLGKALAQELAFRFVDLDSVIEEAEQFSIPEIFSQHGEGHFREAEARALRSLTGWANAVVATGGGTPCFHQNMSWMQENGLTVFLEVPLQELEYRLRSQTHRPLLAGKTKPLKQKLHETLSARKRYYVQAAVNVAATTIHVKELAQLVRDNLAYR